MSLLDAPATVPGQTAAGPGGRGRAWTSTGGLVAAGVVGMAGLAQLAAAGSGFAPQTWLPALVVAAAVSASIALARRAPGVAVALVWVAGVVQVSGGVDVLFAQLSVVVVAFAAARWGSAGVVWASGLSVPAGCLAVAGYALVRSAALTNPVAGLPAVLVARGVPLGQVLAVAAAGVVAVLALPWLVGLVARFAASSRASARETEAARAQRADAQDLAALRTAQTHLAREVHDVVGHSLTVILAQAESAQYLRDDDVGAMRATMATVATCARRSLGEVRAVLTSTADLTSLAPEPGGQGSGGGAGNLDALVAGVAAAHQVREVVLGPPSVLSAPAGAVAYRVLQEMLTNALKHGYREAPVDVERAWGADLVVTVTNVAGTDDGGPWQEGRGVVGMRQRLASVGGNLTIDRRASAESADGGGGAVVVSVRALIPLPRGGR